MKNYDNMFNFIFNMNETLLDVKDGMNKMFANNGYQLTVANYVILSYLWKENNLSQQQICNLTCKNKSNLTRILDSMEKKNLIIRKANLKDRRSFIISLTDYGITLENSIEKLVMEYGNKVFHKSEDWDIEKLNSVFLQIQHSLATIAKNVD